MAARKCAWPGIVAVLCATLIAAQAAAAEKLEHEIGGPLAGVKLPLFKGQHGEEPGHPGCIPELIKKGKDVRDMGTNYVEWGRQGLSPEWELYPGSVEHWRAYMFKYMPIRSFFDRQSQLKNWAAPGIPGADKPQTEQYAAPVYWIPRHAPVRDTGRKLKPVPVIRCKVKAPVFQLDLGALDIGMYAVRVIAAVETRQLRTFRRPAFLRMRVNDGLNGEVNEYRKRIGYCDEFYSVCEFYFHAPRRRQYRAELWLAEGSEVDLLVHNLSLDDVLAGATRQATKKSVYLHSGRPAAIQESKYDRGTRMARDAAIWNYLPPLNHQGSGNSFRQASFNSIFHPDVAFGAEQNDRQAVQQEHGAWRAPPGLLRNRGRLSNDQKLWDLFLVNEKLGLKYTLDDMRNYRPLPDPYPYKDDGTGLYFVDPDDPKKGKVFAEVAIEVMNRIRYFPTIAQPAVKAWRDGGDVDAARDGAIALARYAYLFPSIESAAYLCNASRDPGVYGRNLYNRRRETAAFFMTHYASYMNAPKWYDGLFDYIQGNQELADSINRFVPWVKTPADVIRLLDVYLVQTTAKRIMRYHYHTGPMGVAECAAILGPGEVTKPWLDWLFARTFVYPLKPAGIQNLMICGCGRSGPEYIGSTYYAQGEGARRVAAGLQRFKSMGLLPEKYDLTDTRRYPKPLAKCYWHLDQIVGGKDFCRIGDVCGPDKRPGHTMGGLTGAAVWGWRWSKDPKFAWIVKNRGALKQFPQDQWPEIEKAAAAIKRAPWLDNRSRMLYNWMGVLETGLQYNDFQNRRGVYLRIGAGIGHQHNDALDLQCFAHGLPMTIDGGQRPGYTTPGDRSKIVHNTVIVSGRPGRTNAWLRCLSDAEGALYLCADAPPAGDVKLFRRSVALIDVDTRPENSYIFDVFRVAGGKRHTYSLHGPITDEVTTNAKMQPVKSQAGSADAAALAAFKRTPDSWIAGDAPDILETTWRYSRGKGPGTEKFMLGRQYDPASPRKFTRLHLLDVGGLRVRRADVDCHKWHYKYHSQMLERGGGDETVESAFTAIIEPYVGEPFIVARKALAIAGNEADALKAVAVAVRTANGQNDVCFADGRPERTRAVGGLRAAGEFAYYSTDANGFRSAALTGGTLLKGPDIEIKVARREYTGKITAVDYLEKTMKIDAAWPEVCGGGVFEIIAPRRTTAYTSASVKPAGRDSVITVTHGADYYRSRVRDVDPKTGKVTCQVNTALRKLAGLTHDFVASNDARTKFWRAEVAAGSEFILTGAPVSLADFAPQNALRLWEYGVGDAVRMSTFAAVRRVEPGVYEIAGNADLEVMLPGGIRKALTAAALAKSGGTVQVRVK